MWLESRAEVPTLRKPRLLRNSKILSHIVIRCFGNHNMLWFLTLKFEFRNSLKPRRDGAASVFMLPAKNSKGQRWANPPLVVDFQLQGLRGVGRRALDIHSH